jgi:hypothetical protein
VRLSRAVLPVALVVAPLIALGAPGQAERALRIALLAAVGAAVVDLLRGLAAHLPPDSSSPFAPPRRRPEAPVLPTGLVELERDVRLATMQTLPDRTVRLERLRAVAAAAARRRLARQGLDLDAADDALAAQTMLGSDTWEFVTARRSTVDVTRLIEALEAPPREAR